MNGLPFHSANLPSEFSISTLTSCPYLPERHEKLLYIDANSLQAPLTIDSLNKSGFRRTRNFFYQNICPNCNACQSIRVLVPQWRITPSLQRIMRKNRHLTSQNIHINNIDEHHFQLMRDYLQDRHHDSAMQALDMNEFYQILGAGMTQNFTQIREWRIDQKLVAMMIIDKFKDGLSAVYSCYSREYPQLSLGHYMICCLLHQAQSLNYPYVYLGYFIKELPNMSYKARFVPNEIFDQGVWRTYRNIT